MDFAEQAKKFVRSTNRIRRNNGQKMIDETTRGESFVIIYLLQKNRCALPSEISGEMSISTARIAAVLNSLEAKGLITRRIDAGDRRKILVSLTEAGRGQAEKCENILTSRAENILRWLGERDAAELLRIMERLENYSLISEDTKCSKF